MWQDIKREFLKITKRLEFAAVRLKKVEFAALLKYFFNFVPRGTIAPNFLDKKQYQPTAQELIDSFMFLCYYNYCNVIIIFIIFTIISLILHLGKEVV